MTSDGLTRFRPGLVFACALGLSLGIASFHGSALAGVGDRNEAKPFPSLANDAKAGGVIVVAKKDDDDGDKDDNKKHRKGGKKANRDKDDHDGNGNGHRNWVDDDGSHDGGGDWDKNGYKNWSQNHKNHGKGWSNYNNKWNKSWNKHAYVRHWNHKPYYGEFIGGVVLGSILAANGVGVVPYAPEPYLCWYWADPYMIRGYWDYCY